ncbi:MAG: hypothetical protein U0Q16_29040 [Bryobacteraceae bacterium]
MIPSCELADTDPVVTKVWLEALRKLTPGEKLGLVFGMMDFLHDVTARQIRAEHPEFSERDVLREIATRKYGSDLADRAYPRVKAAGP